MSLNSQAEVIGSQPLPGSQCYIPPATPLDTPATSNPQQIAVRSKHAQLKQGKSAKFSQDVAATQNGRKLTANTATYNQKAQTLTAQGNVKYQDNLLSVDSKKIETNLKSNATHIDNAKYRFNDRNGRGSAKDIKMGADRTLSMKKAVYTACPPGDDSWSLSASSIHIDKSRDWAVAHNAVFHIHDIPVLYLPYFTYPISNKRQTGFLFPGLTSSTKNGADISAPFYWNMAPNYDLTLTPRYMSKRGNQLKSSFRYLAGGQLGEIDYEYLPDDRIADETRSLFHWQNNGRIGLHWHINTTYSHVSDPNYFSDLGSTYVSSTDQLLQQGKVNYEDTNWNAGILVNNYQILGNTESPHKILPELHYFGLWNTGLGDLNFGFKSQLVRFTDSDPTVYTGERYHFEPSLQLPLSVPGGYLNSQISLLQTYYNQDTKGDSALASHVSRTIPEYRVNTGLNFDRDFSLWGSDYRQTIEPQVQYLYIPYRNQSDIGIYDTAPLEQDYFGMFRERRYSGLDRIADANQITAGATTRFLNAQNEEKFRLSVAQIFYFKPSRVTLPDSEDTIERGHSALAFEGDINFSHDWYFHSGLQLNRKNNKVNDSNAALEWKPAADKLVQLNYRYGLPNGTLKDEINQIGMKLSWPLRQNIHLVGSYYQDLYVHRNIESILGVRYDSCCWAAQVSLRRTLSQHYDEDGNLEPLGEIDKAIHFQFMLKGLGVSNSTAAYRKMMNSGRFPYGHPFYLNN
ncbi:MAG: LPS-assembly protein LptD [Candidatus Celerinatantimonas neptuna]|nr:MAG: LPS-assembly protein LptD [Candidatus Celerinatantimonas neptuna]